MIYICNIGLSSDLLLPAKMENSLAAGVREFEQIRARNLNRLEHALGLSDQMGRCNQRWLRKDFMIDRILFNREKRMIWWRDPSIEMA